MAEQANWYVAHTYSGYENKVATDLMTMVENRHLQDLICDVKVPTETRIEEVFDKRGNKTGEKEVQSKLYPGYVFIKMVMNDNTWYIVRNTRGCTGFVGPESKPEPLTEAEVAKMGVETTVDLEVEYKVGDTVEITAGPMEGSVGTVDEIDIPARKVRVRITMFGPRASGRAGAASGQAVLSISQDTLVSGKDRERACARGTVFIGRAEVVRPWEVCTAGRNSPQNLEVQVLWHRKSLATSSCKSPPARQLRLPLLVLLWVRRASTSWRSPRSSTSVPRTRWA